MASLPGQPHLADHGAVVEENRIPYASSCSAEAGLVTCDDGVAAAAAASGVHETRKSAAVLGASTWTEAGHGDHGD